jgi:hypothetical protein
MTTCGVSALALGFVRARRGDPDYWPVLDEASELASSVGDLDEQPPRSRLTSTSSCGRVPCCSRYSGGVRTPVDGYAGIEHRDQAIKETRWHGVKRTS